MKNNDMPATVLPGQLPLPFEELNPAHQHVLRVACPRCGAQPGQRCDHTVRPSMGYCCIPRKTAADGVLRVTRQIYRSTKRPRRSNESVRCYENLHQLCSGALRQNHGVTTKCSCKCHKEEPANARK